MLIKEENYSSSKNFFIFIFKNVKSFKTFKKLGFLLILLFYSLGLIFISSKEKEFFVEKLRLLIPAVVTRAKMSKAINNSTSVKPFITFNPSL